MKQNIKKRVAVGLSGGVDSSVAAALLIDQGYVVTGVYITCWDQPVLRQAQDFGNAIASRCRSEEDRQEALDIALQLGISFVHLDYQKEYKEKVYEYMISEYEVGRTPNPDVICNKEIKFGLFYDWAMKEGYDFVATGHYAQIEEVLSVKCKVLSQTKDSTLHTPHYTLKRSVDEHKDQTYFLYQLRQEQLEHILFPVGHLTKKEVRAEAERRKLLSALKPDSQGICFIGEVNVSKFLEERIEKREGSLVLLPSHFDSAILARPSGRAVDATQNASATIVGTHKGVWFYTIGQRIGNRGQGTGDSKKWDENLKNAGFDPTKLPHFYVISKDMEKNILYMGTDEMLFTDEITVGEMHWIGEEKYGKYKSMGSMEGFVVRIRHTGELVQVKSIAIKPPDYLTIKLVHPVRAVASGQAAVLYEADVCLGGGVII